MTTSNTEARFGEIALDSFLDLRDQCRRVCHVAPSPDGEDPAEAPDGEEVAEADRETYDREIDRLRDLYTNSLVLGVPKAILDRTLREHLPPPIAERLLLNPIGR